jgi:predicted nicotinamide N-methyase
MPGDNATNAVNQPRNWIVTDATRPYIFKYLQYGKPVNVEIHQTPNEETWPGGALWDIGVLLANIVVCLGGFECFSTSSISSSSVPSPKTSVKAKNVKPPARLLHAFTSTKDLTVLELGCGVGLTGIVASAVLGTQLTILTDLDVVVNQVTQPNVERNSTIASIPSASSSSSSSSSKKHVYRISKSGKRGRIMSMPLCWGNTDDEDAVLDCFRQFAKVTKPSKTRQQKELKERQQLQRKGGSHSTASSPPTSTPAPRDLGQPDLIIIGDVAYQHRPGAQSHFDALVSTLLRFLGPHTTVIFGTRMRMPASLDLLELFRLYMDEIVDPPIAADEIDPTFGSFKHQITVHVLRKRSA